MKKQVSLLSLYSLCTLLLFTVALSCQKIKAKEFKGDQTECALSTKTKVLGEGVEAYVVTEEDIENYVSFKRLRKDPELDNNDLKGITPLEWNDATCLYVLEYEKGYEILSADKRSQVPLVFDREGLFEFPTEESPLGFHINMLAEDVWLSLYRSELLEEPDYETRENMESSLLFWALINSDYDTIQANSIQTKANNDTIILNPNEGHWELLNVSYQDAVYDTVGHLVPTWWHQTAPFNEYCPYYSTYSTTRCLAGCVAIAAAQVLNYLHYKLGVPTESPSIGNCIGYVYNNTVYQYFGAYSSGTWGSMSPSSDPSGYAAKLIGDVGKKVNMIYDPYYSGANTLDLKDSVFHPYGIQCANHNSYSGTFLKSNLENGFPVICAGYRKEVDASGDESYTGHTFIVDSYIRYQRAIILTYEWVFDDPNLYPGYTITRNTITYETPRIMFYQMNWGYGYEANYNNVWCGMNGVWQYGTLTPFIYSRQMVCGFSVLNE